jgi:hypothetical protein
VNRNSMNFLHNDLFATFAKHIDARRMIIFRG